MTFQELLDWLLKVPECSGSINFVREEMYGLHIGSKQEHGYVARTMIKNAMYSGRGLTPEEAIKNLGEKLTRKFQV